MKASVEQQLKLLELQTVDLRLARLHHELAKHPLIDKLAKIDEQLGNLKKMALAQQAEITDKTAETTNLADKLDRLVNRRKIQQERLDSGTVLLRDMPALEQEIRRIQERIKELEDQQVLAEENLENSRNALEQTRDKIRQIESQIAATKVELENQQSGTLTEIEQGQARRDQLCTGLDNALLDEYQNAVEKLGALAVLEVHDGYPVNSPIDFPEAELQSFLLAPADELIYSESSGHLIVRTSSSC